MEEEIIEQKIHPAGSYLPIEILCNPEITPTEKMLFGFICNLAKSSKGCWASNAYLGKRLWLGPQSISNAIAKLKKYRYIEVVFEDKKNSNQKQRRIFINKDYPSLYYDAVVAYNDNIDSVEDMETLLKILYPLIRKIILKENIKYNSSSYKEELNLSSINSIHSFPEEMNPADSIVPPPNKIRLHRRSKSQIIKSKSSTQERNPTKEIEPIEVPEPVQDIFDFWLEKGLRLPKRNPSKTLQRCITLVNKLLKGRLSSEDKHKYSPEEIKMTIERFSIAAFDNDFYPIGDRKEKLRHMYISDFIESMIRCNGELTRINPFKKYYNEPPTRITNILPDNPAFTFNLKKYYEKDVLGKVKPKYSTREENNFRKAAEKFLDFLQTNKSRIRGHIDDNQGAGILWKAIMKDAGDPRKINTGWLCSDETWNRRFPAYLNSQGFLLDYGDGGFNMYAPLQK